MASKGIAGRELGLVKFASRDSFVSLGCFMARQGRPLRFKDLEKKASTAMLQLFLEFGVASGLVEAVPLLERGKHYNAYKLTADGLAFYSSLLEWDGKLRKSQLLKK